MRFSHYWKRGSGLRHNLFLAATQQTRQRLDSAGNAPGGHRGCRRFHCGREHQTPTADGYGHWRNSDEPRLFRSSYPHGVDGRRSCGGLIACFCAASSSLSELQLSSDQHIMQRFPGIARAGMASRIARSQNRDLRKSHADVLFGKTDLRETAVLLSPKRTYQRNSRDFPPNRITWCALLADGLSQVSEFLAHHRGTRQLLFDNYRVAIILPNA